MPANVVELIEKSWATRADRRRRRGTIWPADKHAAEVAARPRRIVYIRGSAATEETSAASRRGGRPTPASRAVQRRLASATGCSARWRQASRRWCCWRSSACWSMLLHGAWPALQDVRPRLPGQQGVEPGHRPVRRAGAALRHGGDVGDRAAGRRAGQLRHRAGDHRAGAVAGSSGRSAWRSSCWRRSPASSTACGACSCSRRPSRRTCSPG